MLPAEPVLIKFQGKAVGVEQERVICVPRGTLATRKRDHVNLLRLYLRVAIEQGHARLLYKGRLLDRCF